MRNKLFTVNVAIVACLSLLAACSDDEESHVIKKTNTDTTSNVDNYDELQTVSGEFTQWPGYSPTIHYNFKEQVATATEVPTKNLPEPSTNIYKVYESEWFSFFVGQNARSSNPDVKNSDTAARALLAQLENDFSYICDTMGWPRDKANQAGYRSAVYLIGSGLSSDSEDQDALGGYQSWITYSNGSWPVVMASYYPIYSFDPACTYSDKEAQKSAMTHEMIHALFASMPGGKAAWINEGANCWLQATLTYERQYGKSYTASDFGYLSMGTVIAPFMPIECYSGWLTDGTFGGPNAEGVIGSNPGNVRQMIGGTQYSEVFPTFLGEIVNYNAVPWVWENATDCVLEAIGSKIGEEQIHRMIREFRSRICLCDLGKYSDAVLSLYKNNIGYVVNSETWSVYSTPWKATPYEPTVEDADGWLIPDQITTPGWTGANIIPIYVDSDTLTVAFKPYGSLSTEDNMSCMICYRTTDGTPVYGDAFCNKKFTTTFQKGKPVGNVVFAVVCNLDYKFTGNESIRKNHYDYRVKIKGGHTANVYGNWYNWKSE